MRKRMLYRFTTIKNGAQDFRARKGWVGGLKSNLLIGAYPKLHSIPPCSLVSSPAMDSAVPPVRNFENSLK